MTPFPQIAFQKTLLKVFDSSTILLGINMMNLQMAFIFYPELEELEDDDEKEEDDDEEDVCVTGLVVSPTLWYCLPLI